MPKKIALLKKVFSTERKMIENILLEVIGLFKTTPLFLVWFSEFFSENTRSNFLYYLFFPFLLMLSLLSSHIFNHLIFNASHRRSKIRYSNHPFLFLPLFFLINYFIVNPLTQSVSNKKDNAFIEIISLVLTGLLVRLSTPAYEGIEEKILLQQSKSSWESYNKLGEFYLKIHNIEKALMIYKNLIQNESKLNDQTKKDCQFPILKLAKINVNLKKFTEAEYLLTSLLASNFQASSTKPRSMEAYLLLKQIQFDQAKSIEDKANIIIQLYKSREEISKDNKDYFQLDALRLFFISKLLFESTNPISFKEFMNYFNLSYEQAYNKAIEQKNTIEKYFYLQLALQILTESRKRIRHNPSDPTRDEDIYYRTYYTCGVCLLLLFEKQSKSNAPISKVKIIENFNLALCAGNVKFDDEILLSKKAENAIQKVK